MADNSQLYSMTCQQLNYILEFWENCPFLRKYNYLIWVSHTLGGFVIILGVIYFRRFVNAILGLTKLFWKKCKQRWVSRSLGLPYYLPTSAIIEKMLLIIISKREFILFDIFKLVFMLYSRLKVCLNQLHLHQKAHSWSNNQSILFS